MTSFNDIFKEFDDKKKRDVIEAIAAADQINDWPQSGNRHSNHIDPSSKLYISETASMLNPEAREVFINTMIAIGAIKPRKTGEQKAKK